MGNLAAHDEFVRQAAALTGRANELAEEVNNGLPWEEAIRELAGIGLGLTDEQRQSFVSLAFYGRLDIERDWRLEDQMLEQLLAQTPGRS